MLKSLVETLFEQREQQIQHISYEQELRLFRTIRTGDTSKIPQIIMALKGNHTSHLSKNPLQNLRYLFVVSISQVCRFAIEGGVNMEKAFCSSDLFIQKMDTFSTQEEILNLYEQVLYFYATEVQKSQKKELHASGKIRLSIDYIHNHLHEKLTVKTIATEVGLSPNYYSSLFKKEIGNSVISYIHSVRVQAACNMLHFSEYTSQEIADYLGFSSYSHFCSIFKQYIGQTPLQYRDYHFRKKW